MDKETVKQIRGLEEAVCAVLVAASEQLDIERLIVALKRQYDAYETAAPEVAQHIFQIGRALSQVAALREKRGSEPH